MISVCMATYNGEKYLNEQVDSILMQIHENDELVISDDGSTDRTIEILKQYNDSRIKIFYNKDKHGAIGNFENALKNANGDYIFLSDQDDIWLPEKVKISMQEMQTADLIFSNAKIFNQNTGDTSQLYTSTDNCGLINNIIKNKFIGATIAFRASLLEKVLPFPAKIPMHDQWIGLLAELYGKTSYIKESLILYRRHQDNASTTGNQSSYNLIDKIKFRINITKALLSRIIK